jgi:hypothetical protein
LKLGDLLDAHPRLHTGRDHLDHFGRVLAEHVSADDLPSRGLDYQLAEPFRLPVGDGPQHVLVAGHRDGAVVAGAGLLLGEPDAAVLGIGETAAGTISWTPRRRGPSTAFSAATRPSSVALLTSMLFPSTSPAAKMLGETWAKALWFTVDGLDFANWGVGTLILGVSCAIALVTVKYWSRTSLNPRWAVVVAWGIVVIGVACLTDAVINIIRLIAVPKENLFGVPIGVSAGWGLWLVAFSSAVICVAGTMISLQVAESLDLDPQSGNQQSPGMTVGGERQLPFRQSCW